MYTFDEINNCTGFANGELFSTEQEVRDYFTPDNQREMFGNDGITDQDELNMMAQAVIDHGWHMRKYEITGESYLSPHSRMVWFGNTVNEWRGDDGDDGTNTEFTIDEVNGGELDTANRAAGEDVTNITVREIVFAD